MKIKIKSVTKIDHAYTKEIVFEREGVEYKATLYWDNHDAYNLELDGKDYPDWITEWDEDETIEYTLDELTDIHALTENI